MRSGSRVKHYLLRQMTSVGMGRAAAGAGERAGLAVGGVVVVDGGVSMVGGRALAAAVVVVVEGGIVLVLVLVVSAAAIWVAFGFFLVMVPGCDCDGD